MSLPAPTATARVEPESRLVIVRHGEAVCNVVPYIGGHNTCKGLTERGRAQAEALARRVARTGELADWAALYTSMLPRAIETAAALAPVLGGEFISDDGLCERHPGEADGLTFEQYEQVYGRSSLPGVTPELPFSPGGESWVGFLDRAGAALARVVAAHPGGLVVVVAHGGIIDASMIRFLELPEHGTRVRLHPTHTSITEWSHTGTQWRLVRYNDAAHLALDADAAELTSTPPAWVRVDPALAPVESAPPVA